jgi:malonyl-CoA/methylmalonyl-CoA synthetase
VLEGVGDVAVIGAPHPDFGEGVVAVVAPRAGAVIAPEAVNEALRETLASYKRPKLVLVRDALPRNAMGKVEKAALRRELESAFV